MTEFNIDDVLGQFGGSSSKPAKKSGLDLDGILSQFGGEGSTSYGGTIKEEGKPTRVIINTDPKPPISGISKEASDEINATRIENKGGANPRELLPRTNISEAAYNADASGKALVSEGVTDFETGHPYKGAGKVALGSLARLTSPVTGIVEGGISTPITDITGSKDIGDRAGFVAGSAIPIVPGGGAIIKAIPKNRALSTLVENIGEDALPGVVKAMKENPRLTPADLSPRVLQDTQHLFATEGKHIDHLANTSAARMAGRKDAMEAAYDTSGGVAPDLAKKMTELAEASKKVGSEQINPLVKAAKPVDVTGTVDKIDSILKPGAMKVVSEESTLALPAVKQALSAARGWLTNGKELRTGAEDLHDIQKALRRQGYALTKSANSGEREVGQALLKIRNNLVGDIDKASPGYAKALENYRDEMHIADAFREGHDKIFVASKKIENDPSFVKKWYEGLTDAEKQAATEGARAAIYTEMGVAKNGALAGESVARSDFNKAKMEILFGKEETEKLLNKLAVERAIANTHNKIVEGSQTAMRTASKSQFTLPTKSDVAGAMLPTALLEGANMVASGIPGVGTAVYMGAKGGAAIKDAVKMKLAREHNARYAQYALPTEGPSRDELIRQLEARIAPKQSLLTRGAGTITRLVGP